MINIKEYIDNIETAVIHANTAYWLTIRPNLKDFFQRYLFGLLSIHTTWENNVKGYNKLKGLDWEEDKGILSRKVIESKVGLHENRTRGIWDLFVKFKMNPYFYLKRNDEDWKQFRNRITEDTYFLGYAKASFSIFLCYPESEIICLDTHLLKALGWKKKQPPGKKQYNLMEDKWLNICKQKNYHPGIVREIYWNKIQGKTDSKYWSYCLE